MSFTKDPDAVLDYQVDWSAWLASALGGADTIATSTWIVPDGITKNSDTHTDNTATLWVSGGTAGTAYNLVNRITTAGGRTNDLTLRLYLEHT
jgi:hypothetical protein